MQFRSTLRWQALLAAAILLVLVLALASCSSGSKTGLSADNVWARPAKMMEMTGMDHNAEATPAGDMGGGMGDMAGMGHGGANSAVYMMLKNGTDKADRLVSATADVAMTIEIHETVMQGDVMQMQQVAGGLEIPAKGQVELKPGGYHVMLIGLTKDLNVGDKFPLTLTFANGESMQLEVPVREP
ncbi:MAG: copper chaperone PCu(A)C [Caldilineales bacterium]